MASCARSTRSGLATKTEKERASGIDYVSAGSITDWKKGGETSQRLLSINSAPARPRVGRQCGRNRHSQGDLVVKKCWLRESTGGPI